MNQDPGTTRHAKQRVEFLIAQGHSHVGAAIRVLEEERDYCRGELGRFRIALQNVQGVALNGPPDSDAGRLDRIDAIVTEVLT